MIKTTNTLLTAGIVLGAVAFAGPALAQDEVSLSANVAMTSDYRFRGVSLSDEDPAIQGGFDVGHSSGFYVGTWGSSIEQYNGAETEVDLYGGWAGDLGDSGVGFDIGFIYYAYPDGADTNYYEIYTSIGGSVEAIDWSIGGAYVPDQSNVGDEDNIYLSGDLGYSIPDTPFYVGGHLGYEDGALAYEDDKLDWSLTAGVTYQAWDVSVSYVDTDVAAGDAGVVFAVGAAF